MLANNDQTVHLELQRFVAKRIGEYHIRDLKQPCARTFHPDFVVDAIRAAAKAVQATSAEA